MGSIHADRTFNCGGHVGRDEVRLREGGKEDKRAKRIVGLE